MKYHVTPNSDAAPLDVALDGAANPASQGPRDANTAVPTAVPDTALAARIAELLPQTQCTKCGYAGCQPYADAVAAGIANYNQCPPGGAEGVARLARLLGRPVIPLNPQHGVERARPVAQIDERVCIGCTLCMQACPVDAIVGAAKQMHSVIADWCTGCDLCVAPCPVDCITMVPVTGEHTGWQAWSPQQAHAARQRYKAREARAASARAASAARLRERDAARRAQMATAAAVAVPPTDGLASAVQTPDDEAARKRAVIQAALERARQKKAALAASGAGPKNIDNVSPAVQAQIDEAERRRQVLGLTSAAPGAPDQAPQAGATSPTPSHPDQPA